MTKVVLSVHVLAAILFIGPLAVATSMFPSSLLRAAAGEGSLVPVQLLHRVTRVYAVAGLVVPAFGLATAGRMNVLTDPWLIASIALVIVAAALLIGWILPQQGRLLRTLPGVDGRSASPEAAPLESAPVEAAPLESATAEAAPVKTAARRLVVTVGMFNLLWAVVTVLMIVRPGSTTRA